MLRRARVQKSKKERWFKIVLPALLLLHSPTMYLHITFCLARSDLNALHGQICPLILFREGRDEPF